MSEGQVVQRLAALDGGVPVERLRDGQLAEADWPALMGSFGRLDKLPILVDDAPGITPAHLRAGALRARALEGLGLIVVDYLQLMRTGHRSKGRYEEVTEISQALKALAKDLQVPVLALSQLNRDCEARGDKHPMLSDLRESGSLEQDADVVIFLYREEMYDDKTDQLGLCEVHVAKHRNGATGKLTLGFKSALARFEDVTVVRRDIEDMARRRDINGDWL
jgi:replicative DNA helicase